MENEQQLSEIQLLVFNKVRESQQLEYKSAKGIEDKTEITVDVSAMANASGGRIIYGVSEVKDKVNGASPDKIDPISLTDFNHESLEQIINNIQPKIQNIKIDPLKVEDGKFIYIVNIPMSDTAHQAADQKYYRRYNFQRLAMFDYEIRDIMNRAKHPQVILKFDTSGDSLRPVLVNIGKVLARDVRCIYQIPCQYLTHNTKAMVRQGKLYEYYVFDVITKNVIHTGLGEQLPNHELAPPIAQQLRVHDYFQVNFKDSPTISWKVYADNAEVSAGEISLADVVK